MGELLSDADLYDLTGYKYPAKQKAILNKNGIKFIERKDGKIRTTWGCVEQANAAAINDPEPDWEKL